MREKEKTLKVEGKMGIRMEATKILQRKWYEERESYYCNIWMSKKLPAMVMWEREEKEREREPCFFDYVWLKKNQDLFSKIETNPALIIYIF